MDYKVRGFKAGMFIYALAFLLGVVFVQQLSVLPDTSYFLFLLLFVSVLCLLLYVSGVNLKQAGQNLYITLISYIILLIIIGISYATIYANKQLSYQLNESFIGQSIVINGRISNIPVTSGKVTRFEFEIDHYRVLSQTDQLNNESLAEFPQKLRLSWYYAGKVNAGEKWQLEVRLKPIHGFMNPGGFDYEAWLFQHGIHATGYVRKSALNQMQQAAPAWSINVIRQFISQLIDDEIYTKDNSNENNAFALVKALSIGDKSSLTSQQWRVLTQTGTSHLMAISGLHIGLAYLFAYLLIRRVIPAFVMKHVPAQHVALTGGMTVALLYALIAGLSIPTQRAIIMLFALSIMVLIRRNNRPVDSLGFALLLVLLVDPLAVLSAGFWFSFSAVAVIFISVMTEQQQYDENTALWRKLAIILKQWVRLQLIISVFLLPLSLFMFQQVSLVSPLANLLLIPYVSFLVVPVVLLAIVSTFLFQDVAALLFDFSALLLEIIWPVLSYLSEQPFALWVQGDVAVIELLMACAALLLIFFARELSRLIVTVYFSKNRQSVDNLACWAVRLMAGLLFFPLFISNESTLTAGNYQLTVLDVGQGSAAVIQTRNHVAVFDTGAKFSDKLDAGSGVVIPYLRSQGIKDIDRLIISHGDSDHIGGAQSVLDAYPETLLIGQDLDELVVNNKYLNKVRINNKRACVRGMKWQWDGVNFEFLSPHKNSSFSRSKMRNNRSCVLRLSSLSGSVLLTGDIEKKVEEQLLKQYGKQLFSDILVVPHHGSNTSSSIEFITAVSPNISVISAGYKNRYKLPSYKVINRYKTSNRELIQTANSGAITISLSAKRGIVVERYREKARKYWNHYRTR
jgi:competence protein ComEC